MSSHHFLSFFFCFSYAPGFIMERHSLVALNKQVACPEIYPHSHSFTSIDDACTLTVVPGCLLTMGGEMPVLTFLSDPHSYHGTHPFVVVFSGPYACDIFQRALRRVLFQWHLICDTEMEYV